MVLQVRQMCSWIQHKQKPISSYETGAWNVGIQMQLREMYWEFCIAGGTGRPLPNHAPTDRVSEMPEIDSRQMHWSAHKGTTQCGQRGHLRYVRTNIRNETEASEPLPQSPSSACQITVWHLQALVNKSLLMRWLKQSIFLLNTYWIPLQVKAPRRVEGAYAAACTRTAEMYDLWSHFAQPESVG